MDWHVVENCVLSCKTGFARFLQYKTIQEAIDNSSFLQNQMFKYAEKEIIDKVCKGLSEVLGALSS